MYKLDKIDFLKEISNFPKDFEIYHYIISKQFTNQSELYNKLELKCYTCQSDNHLADQCDVTHYYPKQLFSKFKIKDDKQKREEFERKKRFQFNSVSISEKVQNSINDYNLRERRFKRMSMKQQIPLEYIFEEFEEEETQEQHQDDISEIKTMLNQIMNKIAVMPRFIQIFLKFFASTLAFHLCFSKNALPLVQFQIRSITLIIYHQQLIFQFNPVVQYNYLFILYSYSYKLLIFCYTINLQLIFIFISISFFISIFKSSIIIIQNISLNKLQKFKPQNIFIPQKPKYDPYETIFEIDLVKNYEHFYPEYNLDNIIKRIF